MHNDADNMSSELSPPLTFTDRFERYADISEIIAQALEFQNLQNNGMFFEWRRRRCVWSVVVLGFVVFSVPSPPNRKLLFDVYVEQSHEY